MESLGVVPANAIERSVCIVTVHFAMTIGRSTVSGILVRVVSDRQRPDLLLSVMAVQMAPTYQRAGSTYIHHAECPPRHEWSVTLDLYSPVLSPDVTRVSQLPNSRPSVFMQEAMDLQRA